MAKILGLRFAELRRPMHVFLRRADENGLAEFRSRIFPDLISLAHFITVGGGENWDTAEIVNQNIVYKREYLQILYYRTHDFI